MGLRWGLLVLSGCGRIAFDPVSNDTCSGLGSASFDSRVSMRDGRLLLAPDVTMGTVAGICDGGTSRTWRELAPSTAAAYDKPLATTSETGYVDAQLDANALVAYWSFDGSGPVANGAVVDGYGGATVMSINPDNAGLAYDTGKLGASLHFDGVDAYLKGALTSIAPQPFTLVAWIQLDEVATENHILAPGSVQFFVEDNARLESGDAGGEYSINSTTALVPARWYHAAMVQDAAGWTLYLDGMAEASGPQQIMAGTSLLIGEIVGEGMPSFYTMNGRIDEAAIFSQAMSAAEIRRVYERAARRIRYEARSCDALPCTGGFTGPFSEATNRTAAPATFDLSAVPAGRYLEWRATLETDDVGASPELVDVVVSAGK